MGDDFDLFPKRENLDPFAFGKKDTKTEPDKAEGGDELFGQEEPATGPPPDFPSAPSPEPPAELPPADSPLSGAPQSPPDVPDLPLEGIESAKPAPVSVEPPPVSPPASPPPPDDTAQDSLDSLLSDGPISEEKTFDEPVFDQEQVVEEKSKKSKKRSRKSPSPFVVVGGALIIIIGLLYGALTYLKKEKASPIITTPPVSVAVVPPSRPESAPEPGTPSGEGQTEVQVPDESTQPPENQVAPAEPEAETVKEAVEGETEPAGPKDVPEPAQAPEPAVGSAQSAGTGEVQYSVQVGAFILDSSVAELEKKLRGLGYDPFFKKGSTTAMMNMLTVGPFNRVEDAREALSRLKEAGVDSNMRRRDDGGAIINAGSYLLEENATGIMRKIRSLGYPVKLYKKEARLPMTFVRVGRYPGMSDATGAKDELKGKGLDGIVVKVQ